MWSSSDLLESPVWLIMTCHRPPFLDACVSWDWSLRQHQVDSQHVSKLTLFANRSEHAYQIFLIECFDSNRQIVLVRGAAVVLTTTMVVTRKYLKEMFTTNRGPGGDKHNSRWRIDIQDCYWGLLNVLLWMLNFCRQMIQFEQQIEVDWDDRDWLEYFEHIEIMWTES